MDEKLEKWAEANSVYLSYTHFDRKVAIKDVIDKVSDPNYVKHHAFKPFIHFTKEIVKYSKAKGKYVKARSICKTSHLDACLYQYYSYLLNERYNKTAKRHNLNNNVIAYRTNIRKTNVHYAKELFDFIKESPGCIVMISDFTNFFDTLDHSYLKTQLCSLLNTDRLAEDYYKVYKSVTNFSYVEEEELRLLMERENIKATSSILLPMSRLREYPEIIKTNRSTQGIPQGASISSVLSNVYMLNFDLACKHWVGGYKGLYMRYCDDSVFVFPNTSPDKAKGIFEAFMRLVSHIPGLTLSKEKTRIFHCRHNTVENLGASIGTTDDKNVIDYLGFTFDGIRIRIRDKTISKYYYRLYKKLDTVKKHNEKSQSGKKYGTQNLYAIYSAKGLKSSDRRFLSYIKRCENVFGKHEGLSRILYTHYGKIKRRLRS